MRRTAKPFRLLIPLWIFFTLLTPANAEIRVSKLFSNHMVLQRNLNNPVWGKADAGESVTVSIDSQTHQTTADPDGKWKVRLDPMPAGGPHVMIIEGNNRIEIQDILIGEVWFCSGQSNMEVPVKNAANAKLEKLSANYPEIRLLKIQPKGTQEPQENISSTWSICSPEKVQHFSAVGYSFGRRIHQTLGVPVGLISNAWGSSTAESWIPKELLTRYPEFSEYLEKTERKAANYTDEMHQKNIAAYEKAFADWKAGPQTEGRPWPPRDPRFDQHRAGNIYNGMVFPTLGYGMRGIIWYQGESNANRSETYQQLMTLLISTYREQWGIGDFPFYWAQLADFRGESEVPQDPDWARIREAQTQTMNALPHTGQAVIIDLGEGRDIHPRNKQMVGDRLALWALANDYGLELPYRSPQFEKMTIVKDKILLTFDYVGKDGLYAFDTRKLKGFTLAGADKIFVNATAELREKNQVVVYSPEIQYPVAVRYAWANNPVCNLYDRTSDLPVTPFRTDTWPKAE